MIRSKKDYKYYLEADRLSCGIPASSPFTRKIKDFLYPNHVFQFQKNLRKFEYYKNCKKGIFAKVYTIYINQKHNRLSMKLGFSIPPNVFGPGLSIAHYGTIIVNAGAKVGSNCRLHACVNIGTEAGYSDRAPNIGDNCYIGPGAKLYGNIIIKNGTAIGANSVVNKSFDEENIAIAGIPAKKIADVDTLDFLIPGATLINLNINQSMDLSGMTARDVKDKIKHL
jgi:serine O-acetyltransferase